MQKFMQLFEELKHGLLPASPRSRGCDSGSGRLNAHDDVRKIIAPNAASEHSVNVSSVFRHLTRRRMRRLRLTRLRRRRPKSFTTRRNSSTQTKRSPVDQPRRQPQSHRAKRRLNTQRERAKRTLPSSLLDATAVSWFDESNADHFSQPHD